MWCTIYRLRKDGVRLSWLEAEKTAVTGWLVLDDKRGAPGAAPLFHARIAGLTMGRTPPVLELPVVYRINEKWLFIKGREGLHGREVRQTWYCMPAGAQHERTMQN